MWFHHVHRDHGTFGCGRSRRQFHRQYRQGSAGVPVPWSGQCRRHFGRQSAGTWRFPTGEGDGRQDVRAGGRGRYHRDGTVDCRGVRWTLQWANLTPEATRYLSVMLFVCAYYAACGCMTNLTIAGIFSSRRRCEVRSHVRCHRHVADCGAGRAVGRVRVQTARVGGVCAAQHRRMHQNGSRVVALPQVPLAAQCHPMTFCDSAADFMIGLCATSL